MKYLHLVWRNLLRRKFRTTLTMLSIFVSFLLFGILMVLKLAFSMGVEIAGADRLMLTNKMAIRLADVSRALTKVFRNNKLDIEWVYAGDELYIVQTRPLVGHH